MSTLTWTVKKVLDWSFDYLRKHNIDAPKLTSELLLRDVLQCSRVDLYLRFDQWMQPDELAGFREHLKRRVRREPTQYILGEQEFWSMPFQVDARVLIPRPETECLVEEVLRLQKGDMVVETGPFLELGVGSGALTCAMAKEFPEATLVATDISTDVLDVASLNVTELGFAERVSFQQSDLFETLDPTLKFPVILSNPPYIDSATLRELEPEVRDFEPSLALNGGADGLHLVRQILEQAPRYLTKEGLLLIEIGSDQGRAVVEFAESLDCYKVVRLCQDYTGLDRFVCCHRSEMKEIVFEEEPSSPPEEELGEAALESEAGQEAFYREEDEKV